MFRTILSAALVTFCYTSVSAKGNVKLKLSYAGRDNWSYAVGYQSECVFVQGGKTSAKKTEISGVIKGTLTEKKDRLNLGIEKLSMASELYENDVREQLEKKLSEASYSVALIEGFPAVDSEIDLSPDGLPEWNLYMQLAKLLPELPDQPVKKGFAWERSVVLPVKSAQGKVNCEVYRQFKIDKFSPGGDSAFISWKFSYAAPKPAGDSVSVTRYVPMAGKGEGKAVIDLKGEFVARAEMTFVTPVVTLDKTKVNWKEKATLEYRKP